MSWKCRCGSLELPDEPQRPSGCPRRTVSPFLHHDGAALQMAEDGVDAVVELDDDVVAEHEPRPRDLAPEGGEDHQRDRRPARAAAVVVAPVDGGDHAAVGRRVQRLPECGERLGRLEGVALAEAGAVARLGLVHEVGGVGLALAVRAVARQPVAGAVDDDPAAAHRRGDVDRRDVRGGGPERRGHPEREQQEAADAGDERDGAGQVATEGEDGDEARGDEHEAGERRGAAHAGREPEPGRDGSGGGHRAVKCGQGSSSRRARGRRIRRSAWRAGRGRAPWRRPARASTAGRRWAATQP